MVIQSLADVRWLTVLMFRDFAVDMTIAAVPQTAKMEPHSIALPGVNSGNSLMPFTSGVSMAAFCCFSSLMRS